MWTQVCTVYKTPHYRRRKSFIRGYFEYRLVWTPKMAKIYLSAAGCAVGVTPIIAIKTCYYPMRLLQSQEQEHALI